MPTLRPATASACMGLALTCLPCLGQHDAFPRIAVKAGAFVDRATGAPYVPLGVNYFRVGDPGAGKPVHATFCPGLYDPAFVERMMADVAAMGFNTVRTFHVYHVGRNGILASPQSREIAPGYLDNVVHFLTQARAHGLHVIFSWDIWMPPSDWWSGLELPGEAGADLRPDWNPDQGINAFRLHRGSVRARANAVVALIHALRARDPELLSVVMAWELENEVYVSAQRPPFSLHEGQFAFAGRTYDLSSDSEAQALMDAVLVQWANLCADAIHQADPEALVSTGLFSFAAVGRGGPATRSADQTADERIPGRPLALLESRLDYVDLHLYAWRTAEEGVPQYLARNLRSVEWEAVRARAAALGKPLMCGECGVFANYLRSAPNWQEINHELGAQCFRDHVAGLKTNGLAGALYWAYGNPDSTPGDETPALTFHPRYAHILKQTWSAPAGSLMPVGVDEAGARQNIYDDPAARDAFEQIGFDFLMHHFWGSPSLADLQRLDAWAAENGHGYLFNPENATAGREPGDPSVYRKPGGFFQPSPDFLRACLASPRFLGFCFDECEHWICNGIGVTGGLPFEPHFYDAEGGTVEQAYEGNLHNLSLLMDRTFPGLAANAHVPGQVPIVGTESVFPDLQHLFARAGLVQMPKLLKESITPVTLAMAMGAAKQYGVQHWTSIDLWGMPGYPGHSPEELQSALLISFWTGAERTYIENFAYEGSLFTDRDGRAELSPYGLVARDFIRDYLPRRTSRPCFETFAPEIIIVRFPDSDWGQENPGPWIRRNLYGASNLVPDADTRYWLKVWHVISHGTIPTVALNYNTPLGIPYRVLFPANNVAVYDHTAADPALYRTARLVFLVGKRVEPACLATLKSLAESGLTVVATRNLAPPEFAAESPAGYALHPTGAGRWIVTDDVTLPAVRGLLAPYLGSSEELRYVFGNQEIIFTAPEDPNEVQVTIRTN